MSGQLLQEGKIEAASGDCREDQHAPGTFAQPVGTLLHRVLHAARDMQLAERLTVPAAMGVKDLPGGDERGEDFLNEKGIAIRQGIDRVGQI